MALTTVQYHTSISLERKVVLDDDDINVGEKN
jgi:hypothetical protein